MRKILFLTLGGFLVFIGFIGLLLPIVPQIPFLGGGIVFLMMGSRRFSIWVRTTRLYRKYAEKWVEKSELLSRLIG